MAWQLFDEQSVTDTDCLICVTFKLEVTSKEDRKVAKYKHLLIQLVIDRVW